MLGDPKELCTMIWEFSPCQGVLASLLQPKMGEGERMSLQEPHGTGRGDAISKGALVTPCLDNSRNWGCET